MAEDKIGEQSIMGKQNSDPLSEFSNLLTGIIKGHVKVQVIWVTAQTVDWEAKTMVGIGVNDELAFPDILLGLGSVYKKPVVGSHCLVGLIENQDAAGFLIDAEAVEKIEWVNGSGDMQGLALGEVVKQLFNDLLDELGSSQVITMMGLQPLLNAPQISSLKSATDKIVSQFIKSNR